jgi:hypothetical protein
MKHIEPTTHKPARKGRPRLSITDIRTATTLRLAITNDHRLLRNLCDRLNNTEQLLLSALHNTTDTDAWALVAGDTESARNRFVLSTLVGGSLAQVNAVRKEVLSLIADRAKREDAGASSIVLKRAREKSVAVRKRIAARRRKGGVL